MPSLTVSSGLLETGRIRSCSGLINGAVEREGFKTDRMKCRLFPTFSCVSGLSSDLALPVVSDCLTLRFYFISTSNGTKVVL